MPMRKAIILDQKDINRFGTIREVSVSLPALLILWKRDRYLAQTNKKALENLIDEKIKDDEIKANLRQAIDQLWGAFEEMLKKIEEQSLKLTTAINGFYTSGSGGL